MKAPSSFPSRLVWWRKRRGLSQLQLALAAGCSQRHISFLELGRTKPSREMVLRLAVALDAPLRHSNELLLAAGFAPVWTETELGAQTLAPIRNALDYMLTQQEPFPAVVVDRRWNVLQANRGARFGRVPGRADSARRCPQPRRSFGCSWHTAAAPLQLGGRCALFPAKRGG